MNEQQQKEFVIAQALFWAVSLMTPAIVMVVLDAFDKHIPNNIIMFTMPFHLAIAGLAQNYIQKFMKKLRQEDAYPTTSDSE